VFEIVLEEKRLKNFKNIPSLIGEKMNEEKKDQGWVIDEGELRSEGGHITRGVLTNEV